MNCLGGLAAAGSAASSSCSSGLVAAGTGIAAAGATVVNTGAGNFDGGGFVAGTFYTCRSNTVSQDFSRRWSAIDYKIQRQQLHREDIRDLIELTTARVDIYHIVGTLLLAFCMAWYTDNSVSAGGRLPAWFTDLFLISNFAAIGYLILCVLLGMYAALAAKAIGTRLLTSYARISFPTNSEIDNIKVPILFNTKDVVQKYLRTGQQADKEASNEALTEDEQQHFRRFLEELPRWLLYDTWSRACLTFGLNSMLQALSYFSLGVLWFDSPMVAIMSFIAIRVLSTIVLALDIGDLATDWADTCGLAFYNFGPPTIAVCLLTFELFGGDVMSDTSFLPPVLVMVCFATHSRWLWYRFTAFHVAPTPENGICFGRFQPLNFAHVLEWVSPHDHFMEEEEEALLQDVQPVAHEERIEHLTSVENTGQPKAAPSVFERLGSVENAEDDTVKRFNTRYYLENVSEHRSAKGEMNGGHLPGKWSGSTRKVRNLFKKDLARVPATDWMPYRMARRFTITVCSWWLLTGCIHCLFIACSEDRTLKTFVGNDQVRNTSSLAMPALLETDDSEGEQKLDVQWPEPSRLFKVDALHCSGSKIWVTDKFAVYSVGPQAEGPANSLELVQDGSAADVLCAAHRCDILSPPASAEDQWALNPIDLAARSAKQTPRWLYYLSLLATRERRSSKNASTRLPLPHSWRVVSAAWTECPSNGITRITDCVGASIAGWDGATVFVAKLRRAAGPGTWSLHTQFEADPAVGLCSPSGDSADCAEQIGPNTYNDVRALQLSADGTLLTALLGSGVVDIWDLSKGFILQRLQLKQKYTAMCQSGGDMFLSRPGSSGPVLVRTAVPTKRPGSTGADESAQRNPAVPVEGRPGHKSHREDSELQLRTTARQSSRSLRMRPGHKSSEGAS